MHFVWVGNKIIVNNILFSFCIQVSITKKKIHLIMTLMVLKSMVTLVIIKIKPGIDADGKDLHNDQKSNSAGKKNTLIIIIIVCALVFFCIAGVIGIIVYKRRKR